MEEAKAFCCGVLGPPQEGIPNESWAEYQAGSLTIGLDAEPFLPSAQGSRPGGEVRIALAVDNVGQAVADLRARGVEPVFGPAEPEPCYIAAVRDPLGNVIMLPRRQALAHDGAGGRLRRRVHPAPPPRPGQRADGPRQVIGSTPAVRDCDRARRTDLPTAPNPVKVCVPWPEGPRQGRRSPAPPSRRRSRGAGASVRTSGGTCRPPSPRWYRG